MLTPRRFLTGLLICGLGASQPTVAASIDVEVDNDAGPVANAVVYAEPLEGQTLDRPDAPVAEVDQRDREFVPHVLPVLKGTMVRFPNSDETRHHVYSFSEARTFELRLYKGTDAPPVEFGRTGVVTLGCNIHDWMLGYILVLDTPAFDSTGEAGKALIRELPSDRYRVTLWHPRLKKGNERPSRTVNLAAGQRMRLQFRPDLEPKKERGQRGFGNDEESLEEAFAQ